MNTSLLQKAFEAFDAYNASDPNTEHYKGTHYPKELLYAMRMTERLNRYEPQAPEYLQLAARCQHIGRWQIPRKSYPMDKKGYLQWRNELKFHHEAVAADILLRCGYEQETIEKVKFLLLKKELQKNADTKTLEDVICMVFVEYYLDAFAAQHEDDKVVDIIAKTLKKMTPKGIGATLEISVSEKVKDLIQKAAG